MIKGKGLGWTWWLLSVSAQSATATTYAPVTDCGILLNYVLSTPTVRLYSVDETQITNLDPVRLKVYEPHMVWNLPGPQNAARVEKQLHAVLDQIIEQSLATSEHPNLLAEYPRNQRSIEAIKAHISYWVKAFTNRETGQLIFADYKLRAQNEEFKALEVASQKELLFASEDIKLTGRTSFLKLNPIPHFEMAGVRMNWMIQLVPATRPNRGFHFVVYSVKGNESAASRLHNKIFFAKLRDLVFGDPGFTMPSTHSYQFVDTENAGKHSALDFLNALHRLNDNGVAHIDLDLAARSLMIEANLQMMKYFCQVEHLCHKINLDFEHELRRINLTMAKGMQINREAYYDYGSHELEFETLFRHFIGQKYKKSHFEKYTFLGWNDFKEFAKKYTREYSGNQWSLAIAQFIASQSQPRENSVVTLNPHDTMLAENVRADWINLSYKTHAQLFTKRLTLAALLLEDLRFQIKPSPQAYGNRDLKNAHLKLLLGRINELLSSPP